MSMIMIDMYAFIVLVLFLLSFLFCFDCQVDFDFNNVQRRELVSFYGI